MLFRKNSPTYLDSAASGQTPKAVLRAMDGYYRRYRANVHRGMYPASERATEEYEGARKKLAGFLNADPREVVFTRGTTESLNLLAYCLAPTLKPGDEVVMTVMEHHSTIVPWQQLAKRYGFEIKYIGIDGDGQLDMASAREILKSKKIRIVSLIHVSNALGTVVPIRELVGLAHGVGAQVIVDAAQSVGHRPVDVRDLDCDFLAFSGHKMFGPTGIGVLFGKAGRLEAMSPFLYGGDMISRVTFEESQWNELPWKFEAGTPNVAGAIGLGAAVDFIGELGLEAIHRHETEITARAIRRLSRIRDIVIYGPPDGTDRGNLVSFGLKGIHPHDLTDILGRKGLCLRGGHHCAMPLMLLLGLAGTTRASFSVFNAREDVDALARAVGSAVKIFGI